MDTKYTSNFVCCRRVVSQQAPRASLEIFFYQTFGWHWDTTSRQLKSGNHPPWFNAAGLESVLEHDLEQDADDMPMEREARFELELEEGYH